MKLTERMQGKIEALAEKPLSWSTARISKHLRLAQNTVLKAKKAMRAPRVAVARRHRVSEKMRVRRRMVTLLARQTISKHGKVFPRYPTAAEIRAQLIVRGTSVCLATVRKDLKECGFTCRVRKEVPSLDAKHFKLRLHFAKQVIRSGTWRRWVFSDEHLQSCNDHSCRTMWVRNGQRVLGREKKRDQNVPRIMVWAAIGVGYKSKLVVLPEYDYDDGQRKGWRMDAPRYIRYCLSPHVAGLRGRRFMQDGARCHTARATMEYLHRKKVEVEKNWPPYSPDLNPIEQLWAQMKMHVGKVHPQTREELVRCVTEWWEKLPQATIDDLVLSFEHKIRRCMANGGQY